MKKIFILALITIVVASLILIFINSQKGWKKDEKGLLVRNGDHNKELPKEIVIECFNNAGKISTGLLIGDCQKRLCKAEDDKCKGRVTEVFDEMVNK